MDQSAVVDLQGLCKICLQRCMINVNLFCESEESQEILNKIQTCFLLILINDKSKPYSICKDCIDELNRANDFRTKCVTIDQRFRNYCEQEIENNSMKIENIHDVLSNDEDDLFKDDPEPSLDNVILNLNNTELTNVIENKLDINNSDSSFRCTVCNKLLKTKTSLLKHCVSMHEKRKHIGKVSGFGGARRYHCTTCSYSTPHSQTLVNHMRRHNGERPYSCECGKNFTQSSSLAAHRKTHSTDTYFTCSLCGKQFKHAFTLKNHSRVHENGKYTCSICYKVLKSKQSLRAHMHRHYNICNYNCEDCGDTFVTSSELLNHRKNHSLEKNIECHLCGYKTHTKKNLIIHLKRHSGNRTFQCDLCHVAFYTQSNLQRHRRVHTRDKPFSCPTCSQKFTYSPSLNKHMKTVHGIDYKWADFKWKGTKTVKLSVKSDENVIM